MKSQLNAKDFEEDLPSGGFIAGRQALFSPTPLQISDKEWLYLEKLGQSLAKFQQCCEKLYRRSVNGSLPPWLAELIDAGKPDWMVKLQRESQHSYPKVIRPDLLLTPDGFCLTELDAVPGGMGLTSWLAKKYAGKGWESMGGENGILEGWREVFPDGADILVSEESSDYLYEMEYLAKELGGGSKWEIQQAETYKYREDRTKEIYRFFELFDWKNIGKDLFIEKQAQITPPLKPLFEEKLWLSLLWSPFLNSVWNEELRGKHLKRMQNIVPHSWVVDPTPIPPHASLPRLNAHGWNDVAKFSQKERRLVLKISGFSELAWGGRGVHIGHDLPQDAWNSTLKKAQNDFSSQPWVLQKFKEAKAFEHPFFHEENGKVGKLRVRARLCPYYFIEENGQVTLRGCLATLAPADKKKIHGMEDAILTVVAR